MPISQEEAVKWQRDLGIQDGQQSGVLTRLTTGRYPVVSHRTVRDVQTPLHVINLLPPLGALASYRPAFLP